MRMKNDSSAQGRAKALSGPSLAKLLLGTREAFLYTLKLAQLSQDYLRQSGHIIDEYAHFCEGADPAHPWQLRQEYLSARAALRSERPFTASYLKERGKQLRHFLRWYRRQLAAGQVSLGELSPRQLRAYWRTQRRALPYRRRRLSTHLETLLGWLQQRPAAVHSSGLDTLVGEYLQEHRRVRRGRGYGLVLSHRAQIVTRRHLIWLKQQGHLPAATAVVEASRPGARGVEHSAQALLEHFVARVDRKLPEGLRRPLTDYLQQLVCARKLARKSIEAILRTNLTLCRQLASAGHDGFARLGAAQLDQVVCSRLSASCKPEDLLRRRQQIQAEHSRLRGFLGYLYRQGLLGRDLSQVLISPPCYRASRPPKVLSESQVRTLLEAVERNDVRGRRTCAILRLMTTYGLRPVDVAWLGLDDLHWREGQMALVQKKTGRVLTLPLLPEVAAALSDYLRQDRLPGLPHRRVFVSLNWPHRPLLPRTVSETVVQALQEAGLHWARAHHLRATVATHLLRQGEALSTIQEVLGHCTAETTQRYAVTDVVLLREVLEESER
jgi:site-specific recombinase XerD